MSVEILLSFTDVLKTIKKSRLFFIVSFSLFSLLGFFFAITRPLLFTVDGVFKGKQSENPSSFFKALEYLGEEKTTYLAADDPTAFFHSYPVLEGVVKSLKLQGFLIEKPPNKLKEIWYQFKTAKAYGYLKRHSPKSFFSSSIPTPESLVLSDLKPSVSCAELDYTAETALSLKIQFQDPYTYAVYSKKRYLGEGVLGDPFFWDGGHFTLQGYSEKGTVLFFSLLPLKQTILGLKKSLVVKKEKKRSSWIHIQLAHRDRHLATDIVNAAMEQLQHYVQEEGKKKITKQLVYLNQRKEETLSQLDSALRQHTNFLETSLGSQSMLSLDKEMQFLAQKQIEKKQVLRELRAEMESLSSLLWPDESFTFSELVQHLASTQNSFHCPVFSIDTVRSLLQKRHEELNTFVLEEARYNFCLELLKEKDFDATTLLKTLSDSSLKESFEKILSIQKQLADEKNWSEKEQKQLKNHLDTEKLYLAHHIFSLKQGALLQAKQLRIEIEKLQKNLLYLVGEKHEQTLHSLIHLNNQAENFPEKWLAEQKITLNSKLMTEIMESIAKMIELKNISYHMDCLSTSPLQIAIPPLLPDHPHILLKTALGGFIGVFITLLILLIYEAARGPSASVENLNSKGYPIFHGDEGVAHLGLELADKGKIVLIASKKRHRSTDKLFEWLATKGEKVTSFEIENLLMSEKQAPFVCSYQFQEQIDALASNYDRVILEYVGGSHGFLMKALSRICDVVIFKINDERLVDIQHFPSKTLFFFQGGSNASLTLRQIQPLLKKLLKQQSSFYFFLQKSVWGRFLSRKS